MQEMAVMWAQEHKKPNYIAAQSNVAGSLPVPSNFCKLLVLLRTYVCFKPQGTQVYGPGVQDLSNQNASVLVPWQLQYVHFAREYKLRGLMKKVSLTCVLAS